MYSKQFAQPNQIFGELKINQTVGYMRVCVYSIASVWMDISRYGTREWLMYFRMRDLLIQT